MLIRNGTVAVEGALAAGKTTVVHALIAHYRSRGVHVACTGEPARSSPYVEEIVVHGHGARHQLLIADKGHRQRAPLRLPGLRWLLFVSGSWHFG
jgi:hypothetical protein